MRVTDAALAVFAQLYDEQGIPPRRARLPALHAGALQGVLDKLATYPRRLTDLGDDYTSTEMWHETMQQKDNTIHRCPIDDNGFATDTSNWLLSGPHFFLANPFNKAPKRVCTSNGHYDIIDLEAISDGYLPRTNYYPMADRTEYLRRTPRVSWVAWRGYRQASHCILSICSSQSDQYLHGTLSDCHCNPTRRGACSHGAFDGFP